MQERQQGMRTEFPEREELSEELEGMAEETARGARQRAREAIQEAAGRARDTAERAREGAAGGIESAAERLRERTEGAEGIQGAAGTKLAEGMEKTAGYLKEHDTRSMLTGVKRYVREHPARSVLGAAAIGFVLGRTAGMRRPNGRRHGAGRARG